MTDKLDKRAALQLAMRALAVLALVALSTTVLVGGDPVSVRPALVSVPALAHH